MTTRIELLNMAQQLAQHAAARQSVVAQNIANVDTPGFRQQDIPSFAESYNDFGSGDSMRATRPGHFGLSSQEHATKARVVDSGAVAPNGNSVSLEDQLLKSAEIQQQHEMAISIYRSGLGMIRASIGRR